MNFLREKKNKKKLECYTAFEYIIRLWYLKKFNIALLLDDLRMSCTDYAFSRNVYTYIMSEHRNVQPLLLLLLLYREDNIPTLLSS